MSKFEANAITWFEIPVERHRTCPRILRERSVVQADSIPRRRALLHLPNQGQRRRRLHRPAPQSKPAADGTIIFLNADGQLNAAVDRAKTTGSKVLVPRTEIPGGFGFFACITGFGGQPRWPAQPRRVTTRSRRATAHEARRPSLSHRADASLRTPEDRPRSRRAASGLRAHHLSRRARSATRRPTHRRRGGRRLHAAPRFRSSSAYVHTRRT